MIAVSGVRCSGTCEPDGQPTRLMFVPARLSRDRTDSRELKTVSAAVSLQFLSQAHPPARLHQEGIRRVRPEQVFHVAPQLERATVDALLLAALRPDEEERRARAILPPHDRVRPELLRVEPPRVLLEGERTVAVVVVVGARIGELTPVREP